MRYNTAMNTEKTIPAFAATGKASSRDGFTVYGFPYMSYTVIGFIAGSFVSIGKER